MPGNNVNLTTVGKALLPDPRTPAELREDPHHLAAELLSSGSIELGRGTPDEIARAAELLPRGLSVLVPEPLAPTPEAMLALIEELHSLGFDPVPHIAARNVSSRPRLRDFLREAHRLTGLHRILVVGGDASEVAGPYSDASELLRDDLLPESGISEVGLAGYPEGHPQIAAEPLRAALLEKLGIAAQHGLGCHVVTQFSFVPSRILEYCAWLAAVSPDTPVYAGVAGPASLRQLVHFARRCGVAASLSAVGKVGVKVAQLADHVHADEQLGLLAGWVGSHAHGRCNLTGVHLYSFGGFLRTARWLHDHLNAA